MALHPLFKVLIASLGYVLGSIPFGVIFGRVFAGVDVREAGSGNIGATNVARTAGKGVGVLTLVCDAGKGALPVLLAIAILTGEGSGDIYFWVGLTGLLAFLGHVFPIWLNFKGGKGVATAFGVFLVIHPLGAAAGAAVFALLVAIFRIASVGSLAGCAVTTGAVLWRFGPGSPISLFCLAIAAVIVFRHRDNIQRLLRRSERRV